MCDANNEKRKTTHETRNGTTKSKRKRKARRKRKVQIVGNFGILHYQTIGYERKIKMNNAGERESYSKPN